MEPNENDFLTESEIQQELLKLTPAKLIQLANAGRWLSGREHCSDDLLQEAIKRVLDGTRQWKRGMKAEAFLYSAMRSIASANFKKKRVEDGVVSLNEEIAEEEDETTREGADKVSAEESLIESEIDAQAKAALDKIFAAFEDEPIAVAILQGQMDKMSVDDVCKQEGITRTDYDSKRKFIKRRLQEQFPDGWRNL